MGVSENELEHVIDVGYVAKHGMPQIGDLVVGEFVARLLC